MVETAEREDWTAPRFATDGGTLSPIVARVRDIVAQVRDGGLEQIVPADRLVEDLGMDGLDRVDLALTLEEEIGIEISDADADAWTTAGDVAAYVRDRFMKRPIP
ncbi:phosphopantetheine-binding protein [Methylobacterium radiotolerans]|uniref:phosphopantetheine-binding protein n=1 Tax=Methylobacterium radiotolerans TaxID=31998 RepID=UPI001F25D6AE|nr:phosphopantetheine-binding protein [Methylobacterium radiotolerans]UIY44138.1 phosphopantetheine-binding protein [Methylobacterium radiotolerans]